MEHTTLESVRELNHLNQQIPDEDLEQALNTLLKLIAKPDVPPQVAGPMIVKLQAISAKLRIMAVLSQLPRPGTKQTAEKDSCRIRGIACDSGIS